MQRYNVRLDVRGLDLRGTDIDPADLAGGTWDNQTTWPDAAQLNGPVLTQRKPARSTRSVTSPKDQRNDKTGADKGPEIARTQGDGSRDLACDTLGDLELAQVADLFVCGSWRTYLRTNPCPLAGLTVRRGGLRRHG